MAYEKIIKRRFSCGVHVSGHGQQVSTRTGNSIPPGKDIVFEKGVIITMPGKEGDPYTVLDEQSFSVVEAKEEQLKPLS